MNPPISNYYDPANARQLAAYSAQSYASPASHSAQVVECPATDTTAVIFRTTTDLIVAFRGTADIRNWLTDFDFPKLPLYWAAGKVHRGFNDALDSIAEKLDEAINPVDPCRLWVTGHSLGGALAMLFALRLMVRRRMKVAGVYTFGQPRVGNLAFSLGYNAILKERTFRVVHDDDIVPRLPWLFGYCHAGHEVFYSASSPSIAVIDRPFWSRLPVELRGMAQGLFHGQFVPLTDHSIRRYALTA